MESVADVLDYISLVPLAQRGVVRSVPSFRFVLYPEQYARAHMLGLQEMCTIRI